MGRRVEREASRARHGCSDVVVANPLTARWRPRRIASGRSYANERMVTLRRRTEIASRASRTGPASARSVSSSAGDGQSKMTSDAPASS